MEHTQKTAAQRCGDCGNEMPVMAPHECPPCRNCDDGCTAAKFCDGCDETLCKGCWAEHNEDAPCHDEPGHEDSLTIVRGS